MPWLGFHCGFNTMWFRVHSLVYFTEQWPPTAFLKQNGNLYCKHPPPKRTRHTVLFLSPVNAGHLSPLSSSTTMSRTTWVSPQRLWYWTGLSPVPHPSLGSIGLHNRDPIDCGKLQPSSLISNLSPCPSPPVVSLPPDNHTQGRAGKIFIQCIFCILFVFCHFW